MPEERIQKVLARAGVASRRAIEQMIVDGRVEVNGRLVTKLPCFVTGGADEVRPDGRRVRLGRRAAPLKYFLLNKPRGVICTQSDPQGRPRAVDLLPRTRGRVYCVGRLDADSTGLVLLTNDGDLTEHLTHPSHGVVKTYVAQVAGRLSGQAVEKIKAGVHLGGGPTRPAGVKVLRRGPTRTLLEIRLAEGRNREIRRMLAKLGHNVRRLKRVAIGPVTDKGLKVGSFRVLTKAEVATLQRIGRR